jgi:hypothetical protein
MKMNKEEYEKLLKRFALELSEVGVSDELVSLLRDGIDRQPNVVTAGQEETTDRFTYRHKGYQIEAVRTVKLNVRKCQ